MIIGILFMEFHSIKIDSPTGDRISAQLFSNLYQSRLDGKNGQLNEKLLKQDLVTLHSCAVYLVIYSDSSAYTKCAMEHGE